MNGRKARAIRKPAKSYYSGSEYVIHPETGQIRVRGKRGFIRDLKRGIPAADCDVIGWEDEWRRVRLPRVASTPRKGAPRTKFPHERGMKP